MRVEAEAEAKAEAGMKVKAKVDAMLDEEMKAKALADRIPKLRANPAIWALWEEADHESIRIVLTKENEAMLGYKSTYMSVKYDDMPDWLRTKATTKHRDDGESKGLIREVNGTTYDLRTNPPGWVSIPRAVIVGIHDDGYLMHVINQAGNDSGVVFKLLHNGFSRVFKIQTRMEVRGMLVADSRYDFPVYDPGMPQGPLAKSAVPMSK